MQDKRNSQDLTDMAWGKMEAILDKEMPQKKDKKRYFIWMLFGAILITTIGVGIFFQNDKSETKINPSVSSITKSTKEETNSATVNFDESKATQARELPSTKSTKSTKLITEHLSNDFEKAETINQKSNVKVLPTNEIPVEKLNFTKSPQNEIVGISNGIDITQTKNLKNKTNNLIDQNTILKNPIRDLEQSLLIERVELEKDIVTSKSNFSSVRSERLNPASGNVKEEKLLDDQLKSIEYLPNLPIPFLTKPMLNILEGISLPKVDAPHYTKVVKAKSKLKLRPGVYAGAHFNPVFNFGGYEFGLTLTAPISKRFELSTGLGIADLNKKGFERIGIFDQNSSPAVFEDLLNTNGALAFELDKLSTSELASSLQKLIYIQMPVNLNYALNKRIELSGGVNFAYLVNASAEGIIANNQDPTGQSRDYTVSTSELFEENVLNRWDIQLTAGMNIKFGKFVKLNVNYRYGLNHTLTALRADRPTNLTNSSSIKDFNRTIFLGLNYTFPTKKAK